MSSDSSNDVPSADESKPTELSQSGEHPDFSGTFDSGFNSSRQTPDTVNAMESSPLPLLLDSKININPEPLPPNYDEPLDLSNYRKRRLMFEDVNNSVVNDLSHYKIEVVPKDVTSQHGRIKKKRASTDTTEKDERVMLPPHATKVLLQWYKAHVSKPYATNLELALLAQDARIEQSQVRKWLSNKRARSGNTLAKNGQMHPRKMAKLEEIMQVEPFKRLNETSRDILEGLPGHAEEFSHTFDERKPDLTMCASTEEKDNNKLTSSQRQQLETWFIEHIHKPNGPYPDAAMKRELAEKLGLDHSKVVNWFCNRRSRIVPKFKTVKSKPTATVTAVTQGTIDAPTGSQDFSSTLNLLYDRQTESSDQLTLPVRSERGRQKSRESDEADDLSGSKDDKRNNVHDAFLNSYRQAGINCMPSFWGMNSGEMNEAVSQRALHRTDGSVSFPSIPPSVSRNGVNPWMPLLGAVPMINPYTGHSNPCASVGGMFLAHPAAAMIPFFPWHVTGSALPPLTGVAGGVSGGGDVYSLVDVASRRTKHSTTSDIASTVPSKAVEVGPHIPSPLVEVPQFALPSFKDYLAYQRSILEGAGSIPASTVNKETK